MCVYNIYEGIAVLPQIDGSTTRARITMNLRA